MSELLIGFCVLNNKSLLCSLGTLPYNMSALSTIGALILDNNMLSSTLPDSLGAFSQLIQLNVSYNILTGAIPKTFNQMVSMNFLDLSNNAFTGEIIGRFNNSQFLNELFVQNNALSGRIDALFSKFQQTLQSVDFSSNLFTGKLGDIGFCHGSIQFCCFIPRPTSC